REDCLIGGASYAIGRARRRRDQEVAVKITVVVMGLALGLLLSGAEASAANACTLWGMSLEAVDRALMSREVSTAEIAWRNAAAAANVAVETNASSASTRFICEVLLACSIQALGHDLPIVALDQCHLGDGRAGIQVRNRDHGPVSSVGLDRRRGGLGE